MHWIAERSSEKVSLHLKHGSGVAKATCEGHDEWGECAVFNFLDPLLVGPFFDVFVFPVTSVEGFTTR